MGFKLCNILKATFYTLCYTDDSLGFTYNIAVDLLLTFVRFVFLARACFEDYGPKIIIHSDDFVKHSCSLILAQNVVVGKVKG